MPPQAYGCIAFNFLPTRNIAYLQEVLPLKISKVKNLGGYACRVQKKEYQKRLRFDSGATSYLRYIKPSNISKLQQVYKILEAKYFPLTVTMHKDYRLQVFRDHDCSESQKTENEN